MEEDLCLEQGSSMRFLFKLTKVISVWKERNSRQTLHIRKLARKTPGNKSSPKREKKRKIERDKEGEKESEYYRLKWTRTISAHNKQKWWHYTRTCDQWKWREDKSNAFMSLNHMNFATQNMTFPLASENDVWSSSCSMWVDTIP